MDDQNSDEAKHKRMTERRNAGYERKQARATIEKGLLLVLTGPGKGKSSSALGMIVRGIAHGMKIGVVQFIKGAKATGERDVLTKFPNVEWHTIGDGFTWITQNREQDIATAKRAWDQARTFIEDPSYDMVVLDELNAVLHYQYLDVESVLPVFAARAPMQHVIVTGRNAPAPLIEAADLVSDVHVVKHPYRDQGVKAQRGIEF
ncbi:cob(I)yrinic acid a,c-diamide adenosyltransferase [Steroidobacter sp.]|uniref:cob(I)yrinic acid a,c-diamide adenosyltransferase n=1 Tax=Steroidobacter sp. TaxID=1978227 RepID=UPI001A50B3BE|nr:cob(I)yrinic acid a,c-diamide adenosyltransferase [Steroidobacter sp.]MBL8265250.1 cob(I)yrinic acid a,c-diamide adenosyltransferase [Steroidobacter sp.]